METKNRCLLRVCSLFNPVQVKDNIRFISVCQVGKRSGFVDFNLFELGLQKYYLFTVCLILLR